jgi:hypothetical protein
MRVIKYPSVEVFFSMVLKPLVIVLCLSLLLVVRHLVIRFVPEGKIKSLLLLRV